MNYLSKHMHSYRANRKQSARSMLSDWPGEARDDGDLKGMTKRETDLDLDDCLQRACNRNIEVITFIAGKGNRSHDGVKNSFRDVLCSSPYFQYVDDFHLLPGDGGYKVIMKSTILDECGQPSETYFIYADDSNASGFSIRTREYGLGSRAQPHDDDLGKRGFAFKVMIGFVGIFCVAYWMYN